ncbi:MAG: YbgA family protein [Erysipelotrichaceae bacterium]
MPYGYLGTPSLLGKHFYRLTGDSPLSHVRHNLDMLLLIAVHHRKLDIRHWVIEASVFDERMIDTEKWMTLIETWQADGIGISDDFESTLALRNGGLNLKKLDPSVHWIDSGIKEMETVRKIVLDTPILKFTVLEKEWARYKYLILEKDPKIYQGIRRMLNDKTDAPAIEFYRMVDEAMMKEEDRGVAINAYQHVAGYFKQSWDAKQKAEFQVLLEKFRSGEIGSRDIKKVLYDEAIRINERYLIDSYFFIQRKEGNP